MKRPILSKEQISEALKLREEGFTKNQLATKYGVGGTTIWDNVYAPYKKPYKPRPKEPRYRELQLVINVVSLYKKKEYTSNEVSEVLQVPLKEVNYIWGHFS